MTDSSYAEAMRVKTREEARDMVDQLVAKALNEVPTLSAAQARAIQLSNIGYYTGYLDRAQAKWILMLYETEHPIFGKYEDEVTPAQVLDAGRAMAQAHSEGKSMEEATQAAREALKGKDEEPVTSPNFIPIVVT
jgi:hypothetical protein